MSGTKLRLDANEGRPPLPSAMFSCLLDDEVLRRYPDASPLEAAIAGRLRVEPRRVFASAGADDIIDRASRCLAGPGGLVVSTEPGFDEFPASAARSFARYASLPRGAGAPYPVAAARGLLAGEEAAVLMVASPDNPSGAVIGSAELRALSESGAVVILDGTYAEFAADQGIYAEALELPRVVLLGSFSKAWGLAGLRVGWAAGELGLIERLRRAGPPYPLSGLAMAAAMAVLERGQEELSLRVEGIRSEIAGLLGYLRARGVRAWSSEANFVSFQAGDAARLKADLAERGILVRTWPGRPGRENLVRITCPGEAGEFARLLAALGAAGGLA
jgi:histidinol-phosphate/aromatic aminotransferase/cobyric acid decarboxylase-like protein